MQLPTVDVEFLYIFYYFIYYCFVYKIQFIAFM